MCPYGCQHMISFYNIQIIYVIQTTTQCVCFTVWAFIINICLLLKNLKTDNVQHTILNFIRECLQVFIKTQRKIEVRKTNSIDGFFAKRWSANTPAQLTAFKQCPCWLRFCKKSYEIRFSYTYLSLCFYEYLKTLPYTIKIFKTEEWMFYYVGLHLLDDW